MTVFPPLDTGELYRVLAESASDTILTIDEESTVLSINPAGERLFGYPAHEVIGRPLQEFMPERHRAAHRAGVARYLATGVRNIPWKGILLSVATKDGREVPVEISFGEFLSAGRRVFSGVLRDVSERIAADAALAANAEQLHTQTIEMEQQIDEAQAIGEELEQTNQELHEANAALQLARDDAESKAARLAAQEKEYRALANSIPTLAWMANPDGWIFWYNDRWYEYTGTVPADMEGWGWQRVHHPEALPHVLEQWTLSINTSQPFEMTFPLRAADGTYRPFLTRVVPLRDESGAVIRWFGTNTDVLHVHAAREAAERAAMRMRRLQSVTALLARARTHDDIASVIIMEATQATGAVTGMLAMRDDATDEAVMLGETGLPGDLKASYARFPLSRDTPTAECLRTSAPIFIGSRDGPDGLLARYPTLRQVWESVGRNALASVPLIVDGRAVAAMSFTFAEPQEFDEDDREFFFTMAGQGAQAVERVAAFAAERRERERSESIVESITDGFLTFDREMRFTYVNARAVAMFGIAREQLIGRDVSTMPHGDRSPFVGLVRRVIAGRQPLALEGYGTITRRWLDLRAYPAEDGGAVAYFQDITERRRQQEASSFLAEASRLLGSSPNHETTLMVLARASIPRLGDWCAVDLLEMDGRAGEPRLTRVALVHEDVGKVALAEEYRRLYPPDWSGARPNPTAQALGGESVLVPVITEEMLAASSQDARHLEFLQALGLVSVMIVPLITGGKVLGIITFCTGESGRHYDEADLRLAEDLAGRAATAVERARLLRDAEAANAAKSEFLRTVSHELRQPLNAIGGLLQLWELGLRGTLSEQQQHDLERIKRNQRQLSLLIEDLLSFARLEAGRLEVDVTSVPVDSVFDNLTTALALDLEARGLEYSCRLADPSLRVLGDADRIHQVLVNLVTNAMKATAPGGRIDVSCDPDDGHVRIHVEDNGVGIPADKLESIFTPFVQVGRALNQPREGAGLGLAISRGLVEAMNGTLTATSTIGQGSKFTVSLPAPPL